MLISNLFTISRIIFSCISLALFHIDSLFANKIALSLLVFACWTDFLDGYLARKYKLESEFGAQLDQLADKWLSLSFLAFLIFKQKIIGPWISLFYINLFREIFVIAIRKNKKVPSSNFGKIKTFLLDTGIVLILMDSTKIAATQIFGLWIILLGTIFALISSIQYIKNLEK